MLSEPEQKDVWEGMLSSEIRADYFAELAGSYRRRQRIAIWLALILSSGAVAVLPVNMPAGFEGLRFILPLLAAITNGYSLAMQNEKFALDSVDLHSGWNELCSGYRNLWNNVYADDAREILGRLQKRGHDLSKTAAAFKYDARAMSRWQSLVEQHYAVQP